LIFYKNEKEGINYLMPSRTASRFVTELLTVNGYHSRIQANGMFNGFQYVHQTYEQRKQFEKDMGFNLNFRYFTTIRHPLERFISSYSPIYPYTDKLRDPEQFKFYMEEKVFSKVSKPPFLQNRTVIDFKGLLNHPSGWYKMQTDYLANEVEVWRYEDGYGREFFDWLWDNFKIQIKLNLKRETGYNKNPHDEKKEIPQEVIDNAENYLKEQIQILGYS